MLLRFGVENYRSIKEYQEISFAAAKLKESVEVDLIEKDNLADDYLPCIGIYGANASGKSNILKALEDMYYKICFSQIQSHSNFKLFNDPFYTGNVEESYANPTHFDCDILVDNVRYHYGFKYNKEIEEEWLYAYPKGVKQVWFYRNKNEEEEFDLSPRGLKGRKATIRDLTRPNSLFLSAAAQNNHQQLTPVYDFFRSKVIPDIYKTTKFTDQVSGILKPMHKILEDEKSKQNILNFLNFADLGIVDIITEKKESSKKEGDKAKEQIDFYFIHKYANGKTKLFHIDDESKGTVALFSLIAPIYYITNLGGILIIDELEASLHPHISLLILKLFNDKKFNTGGGQLIFSTHDTNLLNQEVLRRDQIWFTEKNQDGETCLYPLTDFSSRPTDNFEKGYIQGRYGGIPFIGDLDDLYPKKED